MSATAFGTDHPFVSFKFMKTVVHLQTPGPNIRLEEENQMPAVLITKLTYVMSCQQGHEHLEFCIEIDEEESVDSPSGSLLHKDVQEDLQWDVEKEVYRAEALVKSGICKVEQTKSKMQMGPCSNNTVIFCDFHKCFVPNQNRLRAKQALEPIGMTIAIFLTTLLSFYEGT